MIGNDLVDLTLREAADKARDERFIRRVFTPTEAEEIALASDSDRMLWMLWAAKEAAFKVVRKSDPGAVFSHRCYEVLLEEHPGTVQVASRKVRDSVADLNGQVWVRDGNRRLRGTFVVEWEIQDEWVHCLSVGAVDVAEWVSVAVAGVGRDTEGGDRDDWSVRERRSIRSRESEQVRRLAKRLAREAGLGVVEVVRSTAPDSRRPGPPKLFAVGADQPLSGWDLSLSHDGGFVAAALARVAVRVTGRVPDE